MPKKKWEKIGIHFWGHKDTFAASGVLANWWVLHSFFRPSHFCFPTDPFSWALAKTLIQWAYSFGTYHSSYCLGVSMKLFIYFLKIKPHQLYPYFWFAYILFFDDWLLSTCIQWSPEPTLFENAFQTRNIKTPISHSPGFALNTPNLTYFTPKLFRWLHWCYGGSHFDSRNFR